MRVTPALSSGRPSGRRHAACGMPSPAQAAAAKDRCARRIRHEFDTFFMRIMEAALAIRPILVEPVVVRRQIRQNRSSELQYVDRTLFSIEHFSIWGNEDGKRHCRLPRGIKGGLESSGIVRIE